MKKIMFATAVIMAGVAMADIQSANVVGYVNNTMDPNAAIIRVGAPFSPIGKEAWECDGAVYDQTAVLNDKVSHFDIEGYDVYTYTFLGFDGDVSQGWNWSHIDTEDTWEPISEKVKSFFIFKGDQMFFNRKKTTEFAVSGEVAPLETAQTWTMTDKETMKNIMNPYPVATTLADLETFAQLNDKIAVFSDVYYDVETYTYLGAGNGWSASVYNPDSWEPETKKITDSSFVILPAGVGGFYTQAKVGGKYIGRTWTVDLSKKGE